MKEKANIFDIHRASLHDGPGIRTTVFLKGCPLECQWCHNPEALRAEAELFFQFDKCTYCADCVTVCPQSVHIVADGVHTINYDACQLCGECVEACNYDALKIMGKEMTVSEVIAQVQKDAAFYQNSGGGITLSGGEPLFQFSFSKELLKQCKSLKINTCVETSGFVSPFKFKQLLPYIDVLLFDYKITDSHEHESYTGVPNHVILENLQAAYRYGTAIYLRCPIVPGVNDTDWHLNAIAELSEKFPKLCGIELLPYHDMGNNKRISIGKSETFTELKTVTPEVSQQWIAQLQELGCMKAIIG
jgi:pyruvate formate lyase activating enzyme